MAKMCKSWPGTNIDDLSRFEFSVRYDKVYHTKCIFVGYDRYSQMISFHATDSGKTLILPIVKCEIIVKSAITESGLGPSSIGSEISPDGAGALKSRIIEEGKKDNDYPEDEDATFDYEDEVKVNKSSVLKRKKCNPRIDNRKNKKRER